MLARFVPIVRTFAPVVPGVGTMRYRTFVLYNLIGAALWGIGVTTLGYFLGSVDVVKNNIEIAIVAIVAVSLLPVTIEVIRHRRQARREPASTRRPTRASPSRTDSSSPLSADASPTRSALQCLRRRCGAPAQAGRTGFAVTRRRAAPAGAR